MFDAIIIENKLSQNTDFTERQKEGFGAILNGTTVMKLPYAKDGLTTADNIPTSNPHFGLLFAFSAVA